MSLVRSVLRPAAYRRLLVASVLLGLAVTLLVVYLGELRGIADSLRRLLRFDVVLLMAGATVTNVGLRFVRWQYFLRRVGVRRPIRESLLIYLAALGVSFVPLFAAEIALKGYLIGRGNRRDQSAAWTVGLYERLCDVVVLCLLASLLGVWAGRGSVVGRFWWVFLVPAVTFASFRGRRLAAEAARLFVMLIDRMTRGATTHDDPRITARLVTGRRTVVGLGLGLAAWSLVCVAAAIVVHRSAGGAIRWQAGPLFAAATLLGGVSLSPGGAGVTGLIFGRELIRLGTQGSEAFAIVVAVRALTFWLALGIGQLALLRMALKQREQETHFDALSPVYDAQIPSHIRDLLIERKVHRMLPVLAPVEGLRGLDIGCGLGWYVEALRREGADVVGLDLSRQQARSAHRTGADVLVASAVSLPFQSEVFDFAYAVNVVHHFENREQQRLVLRQVARVLKPGGVFFLHEINTTNPLFRLYMGYVFPLIKRIDEGTELWLKPEALPVADGLRVEGVSYFTFVPDFLPHALLRWMVRLEARLESSRWARYSAHFMATFRKAGGTSRASR
jgi:SAM-dependent methyltransferase